MDLVIKGKNIEVTESLKEYAQKKLSKVASLSDGIVDVVVTMSVIRNKSVQSNQIAEVTLHLSGGVLRAEEATDNMYAAIDLLADKLDRLVIKQKEKMTDHHRGESAARSDSFG